MSLSSLIVQREVATIRQVEEALARQVLYGGDLVTNLLEVGQLPENRLVPLLAESFGMAHAPIGELPAPDSHSRALVPEELASRRAVMPLKVDRDRLILAVAEPLAAEVVSELSFALGLRIELRIAPMVRIRQAIAMWYGTPLERRMQRLVGRLGGYDLTDPGSLPPLLRDAPLVPEAPRPQTVPPPTKIPEVPVGPTMVAQPPRPVMPADVLADAAAEAIALAPTMVASPDLVRELTSGPHPRLSSGSTRPSDDAHEAERAPIRPPSSPPARPLSSPPIRAASSAPQDPVDTFRDPPVEMASFTDATEALAFADTASVDPPRPVVRPPSFIQQARQGLLARPGRRRRGPLPLATAKDELEEAGDRDTLLDLLFDFSCQFFEYTALFIVHGDIAEGRDAFGSGASRETVSTIGVPLDMPSMLATAREKCAPLVTRPSAEGLDRVLMSDLHRKAATAVLVAPVVVRQRSVAILVGDGGDAGVDGSSQGEVAAFATLVGQAFERVIVRRKLSGFSSGAGPADTARVDPGRVLSKPPVSRVPKPPIDREAAAGALGRALGGRTPSELPRAVDPSASERPGAARPLPASPLSASVAPRPYAHEVDAPPAEPAPPSDSNNPPGRPGDVGYRGNLGDFTPTDSDGELAEHVSDRPPPPQVLAVRRPTFPPIPREEPGSPTVDIDIALTLEQSPSISAVTRGPRYPQPEPSEPELFEDELSDRALLDEIEDAPPSYEATPMAPPSQAVVVAAHHPPSPTRSTPSTLPSVIVDVDSEFAELVERLIEDETDEFAEAELLRHGQYAMPAIMARFPGPITVSRPRLEEAPPPRVTECGPVLRLIAGQRRVALPFVLAQVDSRENARRFWATYLLAELAYPEAALAVVARLFDEDEAVRRIARLAARAIAEVAPEPLVEGLDRIVGDTQLSPETRIATIDTLADMRDPISVPALIGALVDDNEEVAHAARRSLVTVTRQDFGTDSQKWLAWWASSSSRHRIEWLIDALTHDVPALRRYAGQELKALTKEYFGYYDDLPKKERERAQLRYREWWKTEGRARFRRS